MYRSKCQIGTIILGDNMIGKRLKELRKSSGLTQQQLADILKLERPTYVRYENELRKLPYDILLKISRYFNVSTDYILGATNTPKPIDKFNLDIKYIKLAQEIQEAKIKPNTIRKMIEAIKSVNK
ncbi:helix-turn-helix transcriptional regulator [Clostridium sp. 'deep sea']|uniref:helix-turn-helix domain-containing protein n=1 Tax=Clostridium sp. 'deep sea' TaxID=2779445 RepID=UPI001FAC6762|nr:helix-turn-helix transcriptional regulator [Clostridium sp. 'deep sea']